VIVGRLIPAGTGLAHHTARKKAKAMGPEAALQAELAEAGVEAGAPAAAAPATTEQPADAA